MELNEIRPSAVLEVQRFTDFDQFRPNDVTGAATNTVPLDPRGFSLSRAMLALPAARLVFQQSFARTFEADMGAGGCAIFVPLSEKFFAKANGRVMDHTMVSLLRGRVPVQAFEPRPNTYLMLGLHSVMQNRGWADHKNGVEQSVVSMEGRENLRSVLWRIAQFSSNAPSRDFADAAEDLQEALYGALDAVLVVKDAMQVRPRSFERHRQMILRLSEFIREYPTLPLHSEELALRLGTSVRTLQSAVQNVHGMSLYRYLRLKRLWLVRHQLTKGHPGASVKAAANANGFWHMGEFSYSYKQIFGELPSETLLRAGGT